MKTLKLLCFFVAFLSVTSCNQIDNVMESSVNEEKVLKSSGEDLGLFEKDLPIYALRDIPIYIISRTSLTYGKYLSTDESGNVSYSDKSPSLYQQWVFDSNDKFSWSREDGYDQEVWYGLYSLQKINGKRYLGRRYVAGNNSSSKDLSMIDKSEGRNNVGHQWHFQRQGFMGELTNLYNLGNKADGVEYYLGIYPDNSNRPYVEHFSNLTNAISFEIQPVENFRLQKITWSLEPQDIVQSLPVFADQATVINNSAANVSMTARFSRKAVENSSFLKTNGFSLTVEAGGKVGIPLISEGKINTSTTTSATWQYGSSESKEDTRSYDFVVDLPPYTSVSVKVLIQMNKISASYTADFVGEQSQRVLRQSGRWEGVQAGQIYYEIVDNKTNKVLKSFDKQPVNAITIEK